MAISEETGEHTLARDIIEVHGAEAVAVARENARIAALAGQALRAKSWIRVLGIIQRRQAGQAAPIWISRDPSAEDIGQK